MIIPAGQILQHCYGKYGIAALNVWCMEQIHALFSAAEKSQSPFIVQITPAAIDYGHADMLLSMIAAAADIPENEVIYCKIYS